MEAKDLLRRREALIAMGVGLGGVYGLDALWRPVQADGAGCLLAREVTEGPYYLPLHLMRRNIRGDRKGTPLALSFVVVNGSSCAPIRGATVEIWHADAAGTYSGVQGNSANFLRGGQKSDAAGKVRFDTIFPGWYRGRTPHIHMKVFVSGSEVHTGQVFFRPSVLRSVYAQGIYARRGQNDTSNAADGIYRQAGARAIVPLARRGATVAAGLKGMLAVGVDLS